MDTSPAGPWLPPWFVTAVIVLVVVAGAAALLAVRARNARRRTSAERAAPPPGPPARFGEDDLPGFLESPPGSAGSRPAPPAAWPPLAGPPPAAPSPGPEVPAAPASGRRRLGVVVMAAGALTALLVAAAVLATVAGPGRTGHDRAEEQRGRGTAALPPAPTSPQPGDPGAGELADVSVGPGRDGGAARLAFGGLLLEQRAVGITATYPTVDVTWNGGTGVAHVRLPTFNCLTAAAPEDPVAAGCLTSLTEYADLPSPALAVTGDDGTLRLRGRFPTYLRPNGSPPVWTGRVYELDVRAAPVAGEPAAGWVRAEGEIRLGEGRAATLDSPDVTVLRGN